MTGRRTSTKNQYDDDQTPRRMAGRTQDEPFLSEGIDRFFYSWGKKKKIKFYTKRTYILFTTTTPTARGDQPTRRRRRSPLSCRRPPPKMFKRRPRKTRAVLTRTTFFSAGLTVGADEGGAKALGHEPQAANVGDRGDRGPRRTLLSHGTMTFSSWQASPFEFTGAAQSRRRPHLQCSPEALPARCRALARRCSRRGRPS